MFVAFSPQIPLQNICILYVMFSLYLSLTLKDTPRKSIYSKSSCIELQFQLLLDMYHILAHIYHCFGRINSKKRELKKKKKRFVDFFFFFRVMLLFALSLF